MSHKIIVGRNKEDLYKFQDKGTAYLGKLYVTMGPTTSLSSEVYLDVVKTHVMLICGKRGSGKCVLGNTLITLNDGTTLPIRDLEKNNNAVFGLNDKLNIKPMRKEGFYKRTVDEILKVKLRSGKEIELTPEHPLLTIKGWVPAEGLLIGSRIATPRKIEAFGKDHMESHKIKLLAYLIAEGHTKGHWVLFSNLNEILLNEFKDCVKKFDSDMKVEEHSKPGCYRVARKNNPHGKKKNLVKEWLKSVNQYGKLAKEKDINQEIFKLKKEDLALFLNRLFSCDGSIYYNNSRNGWEIDYSSSSKQLIHQVHHLLLRFGILSKIRSKKVKCDGKLFDSYEIIISSKNIIKFIEKIGFYHPDKIEKSKKCFEDLKNIVGNPNVDTIPKGLWDVYKPSVSWAQIGRDFGYAHPKAMRERLKYSPSRQTLLQIGKSDQNKSIQLLANSDIFWDEIVGIEKIEGNFEVYDISVPKYHNFLANDIIIHNSYSASVIAEEISRLDAAVKQNLSVLFFDTMGVFWTMKYPNKRQEKLLNQWQLVPKGFDISIFTPHGYSEKYKAKGIPTDHDFALQTAEIDATDWCTIFDIKLTHPVGILVERTLSKLRSSGHAYGISDIIATIQQDIKSTQEIRDAAENRFLAAQSWGLFATKGTTIEDLMQSGSVNVLDISCYTNPLIKALVIGLISKKLLHERIRARKEEELAAIERQQSYFFDEKKQDKPMVWIMIDEAHEFLPKHGKTPATDALVQLLREGRQPGISLVLVTQQPGEIHQDVLTQSDIVLSHKLTSSMDISALNSMMQSYLTTDLAMSLNTLPKLRGSAIILDDNSERIYPVRIHPKRSWHGGEAPSAIKLKKEVTFDF